ncbi:protein DETOXIFICATION 30-like [Capsicum galapagoense]
MITLGLNDAISVRVSNELGAGRSKAAKFSVEVVVIISTLIGVVFVVAVISTKNHYPRLFSGKPEAIHEISKLAYFLAASIFLMRIQLILHGVAVGAGWQYSVAIVNIVCYYIVGLPLGACLGYIANIGVKGIWIGMLYGYLASNSSFDIQNLIHAEERIRTYDDQSSQDEIEQFGSRTTSPLPVVT